VRNRPWYLGSHCKSGRNETPRKEAWPRPEHASHSCLLLSAPLGRQAASTAVSLREPTGRACSSQPGISGTLGAGRGPVTVTCHYTRARRTHDHPPKWDESSMPSPSRGWT
jgi:hypothetical protein